jgi:hypothetical protein
VTSFRIGEAAQLLVGSLAIEVIKSTTVVVEKPGR